MLIATIDLASFYSLNQVAIAIKGMRKVKQAGVNSCLTLWKEGLLSVLDSTSKYDFITSRYDSVETESWDGCCNNIFESYGFEGSDDRGFCV